MIFCARIPFAFKGKILGKYIADLYCAAAKLVIELDGSQHDTPIGIAHDEKRTAFLEDYQLKVIRISNIAIHHNFKGVCDCIDEMVKQILNNA